MSIFDKLSFKRPRASSDLTDVKLIAGLGNPGVEYAGTRHNAGFEVIDRLAERFGTDVKKKKFGGLIGELIYRDKKLLLVKPQGYMNRSGDVVATVKGFYKLTNDDLLVITDDMALEPGRIRIRAKGSAGGHNGLSDIIAKVGGNNFSRLRIGIGSSGSRVIRDYVLSMPSKEDRELIDDAVVRSAEAALCWVTDGVEAAMNIYNVWSRTENKNDVNNDKDSE